MGADALCNRGAQLRAARRWRGRHRPRWRGCPVVASWRDVASTPQTWPHVAAIHTEAAGDAQRVRHRRDCRTMRLHGA
eukprot:gene32270-14496_t